MVARVVVTLIGLVDFGLAVDVQSWQGELDLQAGEDAWIPKANHGKCKAPWHAGNVSLKTLNTLLNFLMVVLIISYIVKTV